MKLISRIILLAILLVFIQGCNTYRFMPSHGGGKRFDEEERAVSAAIRNTVAQVDIKGLTGRKVNIMLVTLAHNGGGSVTLPGFNSASIGYSQNNSYYGNPYQVDNQEGLSANLGYTPNTAGYPTVFGTDQDLTYLEASLQMRLRINGTFTGIPDPEYILYVLVDVLGTNRSRQDSFVVWSDILTASCELTYYVVDVKTNKVESGAKRASAEASYLESSTFGVAGYETQRSQSQTSPNLMPTDINDPVIVSYKTIRKTIKPKKSYDEPKYLDPLESKRQEVESCITAGNWQKAERSLLEIRTVNQNYPGLDALALRVESVKAKSQAAVPAVPAPITEPPVPTTEPAPVTEPVPAAKPVSKLSPLHIDIIHQLNDSHES